MKKLVLLLLFVVLPLSLFSQEEVRQTDGKTVGAETIQMYPNPNGIGILKFKGNILTHQVKIYDVLGKEVLVALLNKENTEVSIGKLKNGVYLVKITNYPLMKLIKI